MTEPCESGIRRQVEQIIVSGRIRRCDSRRKVQRRRETILFTAGYDRRVTVWDATPLPPSQGPHPKEVHQFDSRVLALTVSKDGRWLAAGGEDGTIMAYDLSDSRRTKIDVFDKHGKQKVVFDIASTSDGRIVSSGANPVESDDWHQIFIWDLFSPSAPHYDAIPNSRESFCVAVSRDDKYVVYGGKRNRIRVHKINTAVTEDITLGTHDSGIMNLTFSPSGKYLASVDENRIVKLWNWDSRSVDTPQDSIELIDGRGVGSTYHARPAFHPSKDDILLVVDGNDLVELHLPEGKVVSRFPRTEGPGHGGTVNTAVYSPSGKIIASGGNDSTLRIWDATTGELKDTILHDGPVNDVVFLAEDRLASSGETGTVNIWDLRSLDF